MKKNKDVILFLIRFFISYTVLVGLYQWYLNNSQSKETGHYKVSSITRIVSENSVYLGNGLGYNFKTEQASDELFMKLYTQGTYVAKIIEGCNAVSIIILFIAFVVAFAGSTKKTVLYILFGILSIYELNIFRIVLIAIALKRLPQYSGILHQIIFPGIIYGYTFLLWVIWVRYFAFKKTKNKT